MCCLLFFLLLFFVVVGCLIELFGLLFGGMLIIFEWIDIVFGIGVEVIVGSKVMVYYIGWIYDNCIEIRYGKIFDSFFKYGELFIFVFGVG